ncbi:lipid-binding SYLF domain-containing protein [Dongia rigui]|uniref:Lipid-binding SYLF domain-containing protein n=1 Tax=Dongia rigui TaxID=940149 RepID=A0ABU5E588_9PROT|nr:lipid-binding SYLF domain-containing protein [Dongia rigui]MDY0874532.1 lipid-binding SYLF domain-containing protein [Dongia rigui]
MSFLRTPLTRRALARGAAGLSLAAALGRISPAAALTPQQELVDKARITFEKLIGSLEFGELPGYLKRAKAVMIFPDIFKASFVIGGEGGNGVLMVRDANQGWSQPAFYTLAAGSVGLQIGGQSSETIFTIMSDKALQAVLNDQMKFGGDMSVAAGPIGKGIGANTTTNLDADVYTFAKTAGLYGGVSFNGAGILRKNDWNAVYYGAGTLPQHIVIDRKVSNPNTKDLVNALSPY